MPTWMKRLHTHLPPFVQRHYIIPYNTAVAFYCLQSGFLSIKKTGFVNVVFFQAVGPFANLWASILFVVAGLTMFMGIGLGRRDIEIFGLGSVITSLAVKLIALFLSRGFNSELVGAYSLYAVILIASLARAHAVYYLKILVHTDPATVKLIQ